MTHEEFSELIGSIGLDYAYDHFTDETERQPPFICFIYPNRADLYADNTNYQPIEVARIEFYSVVRDFDTEAEISAILNEAGLPYVLTSEFLSDEEMWMTTYYTSFVLTEGDEEQEQVTEENGNAN